MNNQQILERYINKFANRLEDIYPNCCANKDDYAQTGFLKLEEIKQKKYNKHNFMAYAIVSIARAMRNAAKDSMFILHVPRNDRNIIYKIKKLLSQGYDDEEICDYLQLNFEKLHKLKKIADVYSLETLFPIPTKDYIQCKCEIEDFDLFDFLSSEKLTEIEKQSIIDNLTNSNNNNINRKQRWRIKKRLRSKLMGHGYGI